MTGVPQAHGCFQVRVLGLRRRGWLDCHSCNDVIEVNRPDRAARRRHGKDDPVDAEAAARSFLAGTATIIPKRGRDQVEMIRLLKVSKDSAIDGRTRALNQVRSLLVTAPVALRERLKGLSRSHLITTCASFDPGALNGPMAAAKRALRSLARRQLHCRRTAFRLWMRSSRR